MTCKKEWTRVETMKLITVYEENPVLWDTTCREYRHRKIKNKILKDISAKFNCSTEEIQRKLHNLRNQVSQELRKMKNRKSGDNPDNTYVSNWPYFEAFKFLVPILTSNETKSFRVTKSLVQPTNDMIREETKFLQESQLSELSEEPISIKEETCTAVTKKRKTPEEDDSSTDAVMWKATRVLEKPIDEFQAFGDYVASEIRNLKSRLNQNKLKRTIQLAIVQMSELDDVNN